jgi:alpha-1,2-mannosyltransferase
VHYSAAVHLLAGDLPYRDFVFVHPPGMVLLMLPFAWLGSITSDHTGIAVARLLFVLIGTANAAGVALLLRRFGRISMLAGGGLYAVWTAGTIAERSAMLSPVLNLLVLASFLVLFRHGDRPTPRAAGGAGLLLGLALTVKLWAAIPILLVGVLIFAALRLPGTLRYLGFGVLPVVLICAPFFVSAPGAMATDLVRAQLERDDPVTRTALDRLVFFVGSGVPLPFAVISLAALGLAVAMTFAFSVSRKLRGRELPPEFWWSVLAIAIVGTLLGSRAFFDHYVNFAAPAICLCVGAAVARLAGVMWERPLGLKVAVAAVLAGVVIVPLAVDGANLRPGRMPGQAELAAAVAPYNCVWSPFPYLSIMSDSLTRAARGDCPVPVDQSGIWMMTAVGLPVPGNPAGSRAQSDQADRGNVEAADAIVIGRRHSSYGVDAEMEKVLKTRFTLLKRVSAFEVWVRSPQQR